MKNLIDKLFYNTILNENYPMSYISRQPRRKIQHFIGMAFIGIILGIAIGLSIN